MGAEYVHGFSPINDPQHWRQRAQELRLLAARPKDGEAKEMMLLTASDYDMLARRAALRAVGEQPRLGGLRSELNRNA
jgi:hypothetical protein